MKRSCLTALVALFLLGSSGAQSREERDQRGQGDVGVDEVKFRGVGWVVLRSHNRDQLAEFYLALGMVEGGRSDKVVGLYVGRQAALEIGHLDPDAPPNRIKTSRTQARSVAIFGITDVHEVVARAEKAGATLIERISSEGNDNLYYIGDPDGNVIGFSEMGPMWRDSGD